MKPTVLAALAAAVVAAVGTASAFPFWCMKITPGRLTSNNIEYDTNGGCSGTCNGTYYSCPSDDSCASSLLYGEKQHCSPMTGTQACAKYINGAVNLTTGCCEGGDYDGLSQTVSVQKTSYYYHGAACIHLGSPEGEG